MFKYETTTVAREHRLTLAMCLALLGVGTVRPSTWAGLIRRGLADRLSDGEYDFTATGQEVGEALAGAVGDLIGEQSRASTQRVGRARRGVPSSGGITLAAEVDADARERRRVLDQEHGEADCPIVGQGGCPNCRAADPEVTAEDLSPVLWPECHDAGAHVESDHESSDCGWPPLWPNGAPEPLAADGVGPSLTRADEVRSGECQHGSADHEPSRQSELMRADECRSGDVLLYAGKRRTVLGTWTEGRDIVLSTVHGTLTMPPGTPLMVERAHGPVIGRPQHQRCATRGISSEIPDAGREEPAPRFPFTLIDVA
ncbi:hypothetical protein [Pseudonocardia sp. NPDC046786]|uniref:hypothetical protein n=1 Tax=Pseudonocardia sp. NPDC046786 TaxID=3155471 RepID=UPI00340AF018